MFVSSVFAMSQMVLTRAKGPNVVLMTAAGAHCVRTGTAGGAEQRCGGCGRSGDGAVGSARTRGQRKGKGDGGVVADGVEGASVEAEPVEQSVELPVPQMAEQLVDMPNIVVELTVSGEAGSSGPGERHDRRRRFSSRSACW